LEKLAALVPLPRLHLVRYGGCLAPHSQLRRLITPDPTPARCRSVGGPQRLAVLELGAPAQASVSFDMERYPACGRGTLRILAAITQADVIRKILRHLKLAPEPPPIAPARACQDRFAWTSP
jgi:hypothetical protein